MKKSEMIVGLIVCAVIIGIAGSFFYKAPKYYIEPAKYARLLELGIEKKTPEIEKNMDNYFYQYCGDYTSESCDPYVLNEWINAELALGKTKDDLINEFSIDKILLYHYSRYSNNSFVPDFSWRQIHFTLLSMNNLNMLSNDEKNYWVKKYTEFSPPNINETHKERQFNLIRTFLNISDIEELSKISGVNMDTARKNVCLPILTLTPEDDPCWAHTYLIFKGFCNHEVTPEDKTIINFIIDKTYTTPDAQIFQVCANTARQMIAA